MNYAELCRQIAGEMRATVEVLGVSELASSADWQIADLLDAAAGLWEAVDGHGINMKSAEGCKICAATLLADAVAKGAE